MADTATAPAPTDAKTTATNIVDAIQSKANGKAPVPPAADPKAAPPAADPNAGKKKYVVSGKEIWLTPEQADAYVQKGIAFEPKVSQLGLLQHEVGQFFSKLKEDPVSVLMDKRIGHTPDVVLQKILGSNQVSDSAKEFIGKWYYENVVQPMQLSPEQREAMQAKRELEEYKAREASARDQALKLENQRKVESALNQIKAQIGEAMKESGLPNQDTPLGAALARRVADVMRLGYVQRQTVTPKQAIEKVKAELKEIQTAWYDMLDEESLVKELGEKNAEKVKKYFLKLVKEAEKTAPKVPSTPVKRNERKTMTPDDFRDYLDRLKRGDKS